jgi:galactose mutarotase-like enzyme
MASASKSFRTKAEVSGELADGTVVHRYTLANDQGMAVRILTYGAIVQAIEVLLSLLLSAAVLAGVAGGDGRKDCLAGRSVIAGVPC